MSEISVNKNDDDSVSVHVPYIEGLNVGDNNRFLYRDTWRIEFYCDDSTVTVEAIDLIEFPKCKFRFYAMIDIKHLGDIIKIIIDQIDKLYQDNQISK